jgi:hypothetical protein
MAREATQAEILAVYESQWREVTPECLKAALRDVCSHEKDECFWGRVELPDDDTLNIR